VPTPAAAPAPTANPAKPAPRAVVPGPATDPVASTSEFRTDSPPVSGRRYRRPQSKNKWVWVGVCVVLTAGLVTAGILGAKYLKESIAEKKQPDQYEKLVEQLASAEPGASDEAYAKLKASGSKAEAALQEGAKSDKPDVARKCQELLALASGAPIPGAGGANTGTPAAKTGQFPRRMLFVSISRYMYLNPLTYSEVTPDGIVGPDKTGRAALLMAYEWNVPNDPKSPDGSQLFVLSDSAQSDQKAEIPMPMKNVVVGAYEQFFATSREQDRIVVYFGGHAIEKDGKAYIAPIEGDPDEPEASLIPLSEFYDKLKACQATQKVMIWDVCRFNPQRGRQRPGSEPMTESLYKALAAAPEGTEVVITCQPGENALEFNKIQEPGSRYGDPWYAGSAFLDAVRVASAKANRKAGKQPTQADPIPVADWVAPVARRAGEMASWIASYSDTGGEIPKTETARTLKQTVKVEGKMPATQTAYNPTEPLAKRFAMPTPPKGTAPAEIASIVSEFTVPPIKRDLADTGISDIAFREEVMKDFKEDVPLKDVLADKEKYKFRVATVAALDKIRQKWSITPGETGGPALRETVETPVDDALKTKIKDEQEFWAVGIAELELLNDELDKVKPLKEGEPRRWQAHYEYARAVLKARLAYMNEYNKLMGDVLTGTLPTLDPKLNQDSYRLASSEKMKSKRDVQKLAEEAKEAYLTLITEFKGTPWAIQAKRDKAFSLGLSWQPASSGKEPPKMP
jgi:hypothetical protein